MDRIDVLEFCQAHGIYVNSEEMLDKLVYLTGVAVKLERKRTLDIVQGELDTWVGDYKRIVKVLCDNITDAVKYGDDK